MNPDLPRREAVQPEPAVVTPAELDAQPMLDVDEPERIFPGQPVGESLHHPRVPCCGRDIADCDCWTDEDGKMASEDLVLLAEGIKKL